MRPVFKLRKDTNNGQIQEAPLEQASKKGAVDIKVIHLCTGGLPFRAPV